MDQNRRVWTKIVHLTTLPAGPVSKPMIHAPSPLSLFQERCRNRDGWKIPAERKRAPRLYDTAFQREREVERFLDFVQNLG